jgi:hypothetical protein
MNYWTHWLWTLHRGISVRDVGWLPGTFHTSPEQRLFRVQYTSPQVLLISRNWNELFVLSQLENQSADSGNLLSCWTRCPSAYPRRSIHGFTIRQKGTKPVEQFRYSATLGQGTLNKGILLYIPQIASSTLSNLGCKCSCCTHPLHYGSDPVANIVMSRNVALHCTVLYYYCCCYYYYYYYY